jgi:medium-chain acyl-[acyl-carrier-protein] hydrolase
MHQDQRATSLRDVVPGGAYREALAVRSYEVGRDGRVHPATLLRYLEHLATRASAFVGYDNNWYERHGQAWVIREMALLLGEPPRMNDQLELATWVSEFRRVQAYRECAVWYAGSGRRVVRARGRWGYIDRYSLQVTRVPEGIIRDSPVFREAMAPRRVLEVAAEPAGANGEATLDVIARGYEADSQLHINNCVYADWLEATLEAALPAVRGDYRPRFYHLEYLRPLWPGDVARVTTRWAPVSSRRLIVNQVITAANDGALALRARSEHVRMPVTDE